MTDTLIVPFLALPVVSISEWPFPAQVLESDRWGLQIFLSAQRRLARNSGAEYFPDTDDDVEAAAGETPPECDLAPHTP